MNEQRQKAVMIEVVRWVAVLPTAMLIGFILGPLIEGELALLGPFAESVPVIALTAAVRSFASTVVGGSMAPRYQWQAAAVVGTLFCAPGVVIVGLMVANYSPDTELSPSELASFVVVALASVVGALAAVASVRVHQEA